MSEPVDLHTLAIVVAALRRALEFGWSAKAGDAAEVIAARRAAHATLKWAEGICRGDVEASNARAMETLKAFQTALRRSGLKP